MQVRDRIASLLDDLQSWMHTDQDDHTKVAEQMEDALATFQVLLQKEQEDQARNNQTSLDRENGLEATRADLMLAKAAV
ncbi:hypothetical protein PG996_006142 [Apiospora saccharicola]|uniref:Uncharacterized protein n=1 Tax=Apiospora saccharicola TaxID=335842 RepID=A0ABR1VNG8_9PEZI